MPSQRPPRSNLSRAVAWQVVACAGWLVALSALLYAAYAAPASDRVEDLVRYPVRLAVAYYALAASLMLCLRSEEWTARGVRGGLARCCWSLALAAYLVHLAAAFHY